MANSNAKQRKEREAPLGLKLGYAAGEISDQVAYQGFSFLIFTFYSVVIGLDVNLITIVYIIWWVVNAFNDPVLGILSDRTRTTHLGGGRRRPWLVAMMVALPAIMPFLFTPPLVTDQILVAVYMGFIMIMFDTFYTTYSINHTSLYPEMFRTDRAREEAGAIRRVFMVFGLIIAFAMPSIFVGEYTGNRDIAIPQYQVAGLGFGIAIFVTMAINLKWGIKEAPLEELQKATSMGFIESLKVTCKNKEFIKFVIASTTCWYVFTLLPLILPIYTATVLGQTNSFMTTILLLAAFLSAIPGVLFWSKVDARAGSRNAMGYSMIFWALSLLTLLFVRDFTIAAVLMVPIGFGLGGPTYFIDRNISNVADEDLLRTNCRREASYFGVHSIFIRLGGILVILSVNIVFVYNGWATVDISSLTEGQIIGVQLLMSVFPATALGIGLLFLKAFKLGKKEVKAIQEKMKAC
nr:MFS transporter [Candidatus Sigynarchaeota archaeon]